ncbi:MAG: glycosyltransferase [Planctomycetales bacterium]|nr:glycosyltransferase [Planctomycetales bacterium]
MEDNLRDIGGHYLELASLLADGSRELGYRPTLVTHHSFSQRNPQLRADNRLKDLALDPQFHVRRMENWSLGVDGPALVQRNPSGKFVGGTPALRLLETIREIACRPSRRPKSMLKNWSSAFVESVLRFSPVDGDRIVINTGGDFQILALARALDQINQIGDGRSLTIHVVFHFAIYDSVVTDRARAFGRQVNAAVQQMTPHQIHLHATTDSLTNQLAEVGINASAIPYPTRRRDAVMEKSPTREPIKILLAGMPRAEKGRDEIQGILQAIELPHLRSGRCTWSMQLPRKRWQRMIPPTMHELVDGPAGQSSSVLEVLRGNLTSEDYHAWLDTADVGLFLYDADRYVARCSGVLLEMMIRGVPVIVPDRCWLAEQVRAAEKSGPIGWIYRSTTEIPGILDRLPGQLNDMIQNCRRHAETVASVHSGRNTLLEMGVENRYVDMMRDAG